MESKYPKLLKETKTYRIVLVNDSKIILERRTFNAMQESSWTWVRDISKLSIDSEPLFSVLSEPDVREANSQNSTEGTQVTRRSAS